MVEGNVKAESMEQGAWSKSKRSFDPAISQRCSGRARSKEQFSANSLQSAVGSGQNTENRQISEFTNAQSAIQNLQSEIYTSPWHVLKTKTKCEKFVRDKISGMGMDAFVPVRRRTVRYQRKVKNYELPLITCYMFLRLDASRRNEVLALPYVQGMLRLNGKDCLVSHKEIQWLHKISGTELDVRAETLSLREGDKVILAYGQLAGMEGTLISHRSKHEVCVALESLGMQMVIQVELDMLEKA